jgi:type VI secretion system secreted protein Hcp
VHAFVRQLLTRRIAAPIPAAKTSMSVCVTGAEVLRLRIRPPREKENPVSNTSLYIQFTGIRGTSTDAQHAGWIDILSYSSESKVIAASRGAGVAHQPFGLKSISFVKVIDDASPTLYQFMTQGRLVDEVTLEVTVDETQTRRRYQSLSLKRVMISNIQVSGGKSGDDNRPHESITIVSETSTFTTY